MAQINLTLSQEEILQVLSGNRDEALKFLVERILNEVMKAESEEQIGASRHERSDDRQDYRNGTRERELNTRIGTLTLKVPRHRNQPFHTMVFENYKRSEASLIATMVEMVIAGVSTRKVSRVVETLCGTSFSKSTVSELCKALDKDITEFKTSSLEAVEAPFLMIDATYFKAREDHKVVSKAFLVALAIKNDGEREVVGFDVFDGEDTYSWQTFLSNLKERGLHSVKMIISDAHKAIRKSIAKVFPDAAWQRCQVHLVRNILDATPKSYQKGLQTELRELFTATDYVSAHKRKEEIIADYSDVAERAMDILEEGFEDAMTVMVLPAYIRIKLRSSNLLERLNRELKRRSEVIGVFPNATSILRLMGTVTLEYSDSISYGNRMFAPSRFDEMNEQITREFIAIAQKQVQLLEAA